MASLAEQTRITIRKGLVVLLVRRRSEGTAIQLSPFDACALADQLAKAAEKIRHDALFAREDSQK